MELDRREMVGLYIFLKRNEEQLDGVLFPLYNRMQKVLNEELSIEEMESIEELYAQKVDIFKDKG